MSFIIIWYSYKGEFIWYVHMTVGLRVMDGITPSLYYLYFSIHLPPFWFFFSNCSSNFSFRSHLCFLSRILKRFIHFLLAFLKHALLMFWKIHFYMKFELDVFTCAFRLVVMKGFKLVSNDYYEFLDVKNRLNACDLLYGVEFNSFC